MGLPDQRFASYPSSLNSISFGATTRPEEGDIISPVSPVSPVFPVSPVSQDSPIAPDYEKQTIQIAETGNNIGSTITGPPKPASKAAGLKSWINLRTAGRQTTADAHSGRLWTPWILTIPSLLGFLACLLLILTLLEVLASRQRRRPVRSSASHEIFLWTYGPSFLFCLMAAYWSQIDYRIRQLMPWKTLSTGAAPASRSMLLDYITPWHLKERLLRSLKAGHFAVFLSVCASAVFKILIIFWTGPVLFQESGVVSNSEFEVKPVSLRFMEICLSMLILITIGVLVNRPAQAAPKDPASLASLATIMAQGRAFTAFMQGLAALPWSSFQKNVSELRYHTEIARIRGRQNFQIRVDFSDEEAASASASVHSPGPNLKAWWNPLSDSARLGILAVTFGAITSLEILLQKSYRDSGLAEAGSRTFQYRWAFWPGLVMLVVYYAHNYVDFTIRILQPLAQLRRHPSAPSKSINVSYLFTFSPQVVWDAARNKHWAVVATAIGSIIAPMLLIVASGLYRAELIPIGSSQRVQLLDDFSLNSIPNVMSTQTISAISEALNYSGQYPPWTLDSFVFPRVNFITLPEPGVGSLQLQLPALSASLNCSLVLSSGIRVWNEATPTNTTQQSTSRQVAIPVPRGCGNPCDGTAVCDSDTEYAFAPEAMDQRNYTIYGRMFLTNGSPSPPGWMDDCPQITVVYGSSDETDGSLHDLTALNCYPSVSFSRTLTTVSVPEFSITAATSTAPPSQVVARGDTATIDLNDLPSNVDPKIPNADFDTAFSTALLSLEMPFTPSLLDPRNTTTITSALHTTYARAYAQYLSTASRIPWTHNTTLATATGTLTTPPRARIVQQAVPTRVLEALLALLCLTLVLSTVFLDTRDVVPHNPCSIAVQASLVADSDALVRGAPRGCEWWGARDVKAAGLFEGKLFAMGFRTKGEGGRGGRGGDGQQVRVFGVHVVAAERVGRVGRVGERGGILIEDVSQD